MTRNTISKESIRIALFELLKKKRIYDITVTELCEKAGITRRTFYRHYSNLYNILDESFWLIVEDFREESKWPTYRERIYDYFLKWQSYREYFLIMHKNGLSDYLTKMFVISIREDWPEIDVYKCNYYAFSIYSTLYSWFVERPEDDYKKVADTALELLSI